MAKIKLAGVLNYKKPETWDENQTGFHFHPCDMSAHGYVKVMVQTAEFEIPDNFDPRREQLKGLDLIRKKLMADHSRAMMEVDKDISKLLALEAA